MKFGSIPTREAVNGILAHSVRVDGQRFKKGRVLSEADIEALSAAGIEHIIAAQLQADDVGEDQAADVGEDQAASELAAAICLSDIDIGSAFTGRCNVFAKRRGLFVIDEERLNAINTIHEDLTVATLPSFAVIEPKQMLATVKIIPFGVARDHLVACINAAKGASPLLQVLPFQRRKIGFIQTELPGLKTSILDKTTGVLQTRLTALDAKIIDELRVSHNEADLSQAITKLLHQGAEMILIAGASAIVDRRDVIPAAIIKAGGRVEHFGMPMDPGNLLLVGYHDQIPVLGLPGCARSPKYNGLDPVLARLAAGLTVTGAEIMRMGAGGLLKEIASRPQPRLGEQEPDRAAALAPRVAALILAAGQSRRMGKANKLLLEIDGKPMLQHVAAAVTAAQVDQVIVVTGHEQQQVQQTLANYPVQFVQNPAFADGISSSLAAGLASLAENNIDAVLVCLGDMPGVKAEHINRLIAAFDPLEGRAICVPTYIGKRGNPILWASRFMTEMSSVAGDVGAKHLLGEHADVVCEVEINAPAVLQDYDTPEALALRQR